MPAGQFFSLGPSGTRLRPEARGREGAVSSFASRRRRRTPPGYPPRERGAPSPGGPQRELSPPRRGPRSAAFAHEAFRYIAEALRRLSEEEQERAAAHREGLLALSAAQASMAAAVSDAVGKLGALGEQSSRQATESLQLLYALTGRDELLQEPPSLPPREPFIEIPLDKLRSFAELQRRKETELRSALQALSL